VREEGCGKWKKGAGTGGIYVDHTHKGSATLLPLMNSLCRRTRREGVMKSEGGFVTGAGCNSRKCRQWFKARSEYDENLFGLRPT